MSLARDEPDVIAKTRNLSRFCVENREIAWVALVAVCVWGIYGYLIMPHRRDPDIPMKQALIVTAWPGQTAEKVEQLVTKPIEQTVATQTSVARIESVSRPDVSVVTITLSGRLRQIGQTLDDIGGRLGGVLSLLPPGAGPPAFIRDFGDTATLLLTVASPKADAAEIDFRADAIRSAIERVRPANSKGRISMVLCFPTRNDRRLISLAVEQFIEYLGKLNLVRNVRILDGPGFAGIDFASGADDGTLLGALSTFVTQRYHRSELPPDSWAPFLVRDPSRVLNEVTEVASDKYSYHDLDEFTEVIERALLATARTPEDPPLVARVLRSGLPQERVYLTYSQQRLASYGIKPQQIGSILSARNISAGAGQLDISGKRVGIRPSGEFSSELELGGVPIAVSPAGTPLYLRDVSDTARGYENPPSYLAFHSIKDKGGRWTRSRAVALNVQMGAGQNIETFAKAVNATLADVLSRLPRDLIVEHTSDQPQQVAEIGHLFMSSLYEAILLIVLVSFIGFWEWRAALLMALAIPITLLMTFGMMSAAGVDLQQVSIATLIIALGLLVDDPVVAGDAIGRDLAAGYPPSVASWLAPTRLSTAILFATLTNIMAYLPFLLLSGNTGQFMYSLPVVMTCALVASRVASMTFIPLLAYYILRPKKKEPSAEDRRQRGFGALYYRVGGFCIRRRKTVLLASLLIFAAGGWIGANLRQQFFPKDLSNLAYVNVSLPEDASIELTNDTTGAVERVVERTATEQHISLRSLNTYVGGSAPRFWHTLSPEPNHPNFSQVVLSVEDQRDVLKLLPVVQTRVSREIAGALVDVWQLETGDAVGIPIQVRISGDHIETLRRTAEKVKDTLRSIPAADRIRDDWGEDRFNVELAIDPERATLAGVTNLDVASSSASGTSGIPLTVLREGNKQIPVVARLRADERAQLDDIDNLYVYPAANGQNVPLREFSHFNYTLTTEVIRRRNQYRTITVSAVPRAGVFASSVMTDLLPKIQDLERHLPAGYRIEFGGEKEKQDHGNSELTGVLAVSVVAIYLALAIQFRSSMKPLIVLAAVPYGMVGALAALAIMGTPFGFMAFLGLISLVGVVVSHIIVLFDLIEEKHRLGEPFEEAVLDAGILRLRPVLITVGATVMALVPLALHGGPLWEPMCYAQIGGLIAATAVTLLLVPVMYSICVLDLRIVKWK